MYASRLLKNPGLNRPSASCDAPPRKGARPRPGDGRSVGAVGRDAAGHAAAPGADETLTGVALRTSPLARPGAAPGAVPGARPRDDRSDHGATHRSTRSGT